MELLNEIFPVILYFLGSILLIALIILTIKIIKTMNRVDEVVTDLNNKSRKLNGLFDFVDNTADILSIMSDRVVGLIVTGITNLFSKKKEGGKKI